MTLIDVTFCANAANVVFQDPPLDPPQLNPPVECPYPYIRGTPYCWNDITRQKLFAEGHGWVLRNLTKKQYVYAHVLTSEDGVSKGQDIPDGIHPLGFGFGVLILLRTCWSDLEDDAQVISSVYGTGMWVGDCFDIVVEEKLKRDMGSGEEWQDISVEAREELLLLRETLKRRDGEPS